MASNNFKELEKMLAENKEFTFNKVKNDLIGTRNVFGFLGDLVELFLPRLLDVFISFSSPNTSDNLKNSKYPHEGGKNK